MEGGGVKAFKKRSRGRRKTVVGRTVGRSMGFYDS